MSETRIILSTTAIECEHGYDHCPICDALPSPDDVIDALARLFAPRAPSDRGTAGQNDAAGGS